MSTQFGMWNFDDQPVETKSLEPVEPLLCTYGPDRRNSHSDRGVWMTFHAFDTTKESRRECQPYLTSSGDVLMWDGRLDNREELSEQLALSGRIEVTDLMIVALAFDRWDTDSFRKLIGDWAISIWRSKEKTLILAKDYIGIRHLYYSLTSKRASWCSYLDPLVQLSPAPLTLNHEYVASYLVSYPSAHLTPYREIQAVPPGCFVIVRNGNAHTYRHWSFEPRRRIRYRTDTEYEEHFRHVFRQAVRRRLRSASPIIGELSGGIDSSSLICIADDILANGEGETPRLDTVSIYDPKYSEGDERAYISVVEKRRARVGHHLDRSKYSYSFSLDYHDFGTIPVPSQGNDGLRRALRNLIENHGYRVVLSGNGGDEFLGGVPNPFPQLGDMILLLQPVELVRELMAWSMIKKRPWIQLLFQTLLLFAPLSIRARWREQAGVARWVDASFARHYRLRIRQLGPQGRYGFWQPSRCDYAQTFIAMQRQVAFLPRHVLGNEERRFPYLDQTLFEFLSSVPASQLLRPGQRRSLMRRSLGQIVPREILWRKTKGAVAGSVLAAFENTWADLETLFSSSLSARLGYLNQSGLLDGIRAAKNGEAPQLVHLLRAICLELWLRSLEQRGTIRLPSGFPAALRNISMAEI